MSKWLGSALDKKSLWGSFQWSELEDPLKFEITHIRQLAGGGPVAPTVPPGTDPTPQEMIQATIKQWEPVIMQGLGLGALGLLAWMLYNEAQGKPTILSRVITSPTGTEMVRGAWDFLGSAAKAGAANPALGFMAAWAIVQLMQKAKIVTEKAGAWAIAGVFGLEGVKVGADAIGSLEGIFGGGKAHEGPSSYTLADNRTVNYYPMPSQFGEVKSIAPELLDVGALKAIAAKSKS